MEKNGQEIKRINISSTITNQQIIALQKVIETQQIENRKLQENIELLETELISIENIITNLNKKINNLNDLLSEKEIKIKRIEEINETLQIERNAFDTITKQNKLLLNKLLEEEKLSNNLNEIVNKLKYELKILHENYEIKVKQNTENEIKLSSEIKYLNKNLNDKIKENENYLQQNTIQSQQLDTLLTEFKFEIDKKNSELLRFKLHEYQNLSKFEESKLNYYKIKDENEVLNEIIELKNQQTQSLEVNLNENLNKNNEVNNLLYLLLNKNEENNMKHNLNETKLNNEIRLLKNEVIKLKTLLTELNEKNIYYENYFKDIELQKVMNKKSNNTKGLRNSIDFSSTTDSLPIIQNSNSIGILSTTLDTHNYNNNNNKHVHLPSKSIKRSSSSSSHTKRKTNNLSHNLINSNNQNSNRIQIQNEDSMYHSDEEILGRNLELSITLEDSNSIISQHLFDKYDNERSLYTSTSKLLVNNTSQDLNLQSESIDSSSISINDQHLITSSIPQTNSSIISSSKSPTFNNTKQQNNTFQFSTSTTTAALFDNFQHEGKKCLLAKYLRHMVTLMNTFSLPSNLKINSFDLSRTSLIDTDIVQVIDWLRLISINNLSIIDLRYNLLTYKAMSYLTTWLLSLDRKEFIERNEPLQIFCQYNLVDPVMIPQILALLYQTPHPDIKYIETENNGNVIVIYGNKQTSQKRGRLILKWNFENNCEEQILPIKINNK